MSYKEDLQIDTLEKLKEFCEKLQGAEKKRGFIYRGQQNADWKLQSNLEREILTKLDENQLDELTIFEQIERLHFENVRKLLRGKLKDQTLLNDKNEIWAIGQHFGLKTPLIDWSKNFYIALYFAFEKPFDKEEEQKYRSVYILNKTLLEVDKGNIYIYEPKTDYYGRVSVQQGIFSYWGTEGYLKKILHDFSVYSEKQGESSEWIFLKTKSNFLKININNSLRDEILSYLEHIGITEETIYPDF